MMQSYFQAIIIVKVEHNIDENGNLERLDHQLILIKMKYVFLKERSWWKGKWDITVQSESSLDYVVFRRVRVGQYKKLIYKVLSSQDYRIIKAKLKKAVHDEN